MRIIYLVLFVVGCGVYEEESEIEFITHEHVGVPSIGFLMTKVHRPYWVIGYLLDGGCELRQNEDKLKADLRHYLRVWLAPLKEISLKNKAIVDEFKLENIQSHQHKEPYFNNIRGGVDLVVRYTCKFGASHARKGGVNSDGIYPPFIVMMTTNPAILLHELGHTIGLMDTYAFGNKGVNGHSHDYFRRTMGNQPPSIMSSMTSYDKDHNQRPVLSDDDKRGIKWLYFRYFTGKIHSTYNCYFPGYELEILHKNGHKGCAPVNPLLFLIKNGYPINTMKYPILEEKIQSFFGKRESYGNQLYPSHYLAAMPNNRGLDIFHQIFNYKLPLKHEIYSVKDRKGRTPLHYAIQAGNDKLLSVLLEEEQGLGGNIILKNGMTLLHFAVQHVQLKSVCLLLLHKTTDQTIRDRMRLTPLERAYSRVQFWKRRGRQQEVKAMKQIISLFDSYETNSLKTCDS